MSAIDPKDREALNGIARAIEGAAGPAIGFAALLGTGHYLSNCNREDAHKAIGDWCKRALPRPGAPIASPSEFPELEEKCARIGKLVTEAVPITLFLFDGDKLAFFSSIPDAPARIYRWLKAPS